jgi:lauroyl/myristoyl acyltransferase
MIQKIWKGLSPREVETLRRRISRQEFQNRALRRIYKKKGARGIAPRIRTEAGPLLKLQEQGLPAIVVSWHLGPSRANSLALHQLGLDVLYATFAGPAGEEDASGLPYYELKGNQLYARFLKSAMDRLASGGVVGLALDAAFGRTEPMSFLGGTLSTPRGAAALARLSGAPVLPITGHWTDRGAGIRVTLHPPLPEPDLPRGDRDVWERALMESALHWFADHLQAHPERTRLKELRRYTRD